MECRDFYDPDYVRYLCMSCVDAFKGGFSWTLYDPELHGVINQITRQREDLWPLVGTVRVYRPLKAASAA